MEIRRAYPPDAEAVERLRVRAWQAAYRDIFPLDALDALEPDWERWERHLEPAGDGRATYVAEDASGILGFVSIGPDRDVDAVSNPLGEIHGRGEIYGLYVEPDAWSRGIGRALLELGERELAGGYDDGILWTLERNPQSRRFYERNGWVSDGGRQLFERPDFTSWVVSYTKPLTRPLSRS